MQKYSERFSKSHFFSLFFSPPEKRNISSSMCVIILVVFYFKDQNLLKNADVSREKCQRKESMTFFFSKKAETKTDHKKLIKQSKFLPDCVSCSCSYPLQKCIDQCFVNKHFSSTVFNLFFFFVFGLSEKPKDLRKEQTGNMIYLFLSKHM